MSVKSNYEKPSIQFDGVKPRGVIIVPVTVALLANQLLVANVYTAANLYVMANANGATNVNVGTNWNYTK